MDCSEQLKIDAVVLFLRDFCLRFLYGHAYKLCSRLTQRIKHYKTGSYIDHYQYVMVNRTRLTLLLSLRPHNVGGLYSCKLFLFNEREDSLSFRRIMTCSDSARNVLGEHFIVDLNGNFDSIIDSLSLLFKKKDSFVDGYLDG